MSGWTWILVGLCVLGVLLALGSTAFVALAALRTLKRIGKLRNTRLFISLEALELQSKRFRRLARDAQPLIARGGTAVASIEQSLHSTGLEGARGSMHEATAQAQTLREDLR